MTDTYTLYVYGDANMAMLREAKQKLDAPWKITVKQAGPGDSPVLCWGEDPWWACDYAVSQSWTVKKLMDAVPMCVGVKPLDRRVFRMADWLSNVLGEGAREIAGNQ